MDARRGPSRSAAVPAIALAIRVVSGSNTDDARSRFRAARALLLLFDWALAVRTGKPAVPGAKPFAEMKGKHNMQKINKRNWQSV